MLMPPLHSEQHNSLAGKNVYLLAANKPIIIPLKQRGRGQCARRSPQREKDTVQHKGRGKGAEGAARSAVIPESQQLTHPAGGRAFHSRAGDSKWQRHFCSLRIPHPTQRRQGSDRSHSPIDPPRPFEKCHLQVQTWTQFYTAKEDTLPEKTRGTYSISVAL
ncbi:hypothetical protein Q8A73_017698 [Channa argus]|nr:hypothetical protein Q8A73_017698 [Channa argus]